jgi:3-dehydroquinate dehydratase-1
MLNHSVPEKASFLSAIHAVGSVADGETLDRLPQMDLPALCDVVEYRVDTWPERAEQAVTLAEQSPVPVLVTVRRPDECGQNYLAAEERERLARLFLPSATLLDVEIASLGEMSGLVADAKAAGIIIVASFHDFARTPALDDLKRKRDAAFAAGADVVKFATTLHATADIGTLAALLDALTAGDDVVKLAATLQSTADIVRLAALLEEPCHPPMSVMGMGKLGRVSRLLFAQLGSVLNYGYLDKATVPGQWPAARLRELIREF